MLRDVREYGAKEYGLSGDALDAACFPMSAALAHELISSAHARATANGTGSRKGATAAAPKAKSAPGKLTKAGVLPIAAKCHLEALAAEPQAWISRCASRRAFASSCGPTRRSRSR